MELNNLQKNEVPYSDAYSTSYDINESLSYFEAGFNLTFYLIKYKGFDKMIYNFFADVESKVINECENKQLNKVEYEDIKLSYGCFNSLFKHYYSISLNANRDTFQEHKNWILETFLSSIKKSNDIREKYFYILDFKRGLFETLKYIHLIGGYEEQIGKKETAKQIESKKFEEIERKSREKTANQIIPSEIEPRIEVKDKKILLEDFKCFFKNDILLDNLMKSLKTNDVINADLNFQNKNKTFFSMFIICIEEMKFCKNLDNKRTKLFEAGKNLFEMEVTYSHYNNCREIFLDNKESSSKNQKKYLKYFKSIFKDIQI